MAVNLGDAVRDVITGFEGIVQGRTEYLFGCVSMLVKSREMKDGLPLEGKWLDENQLVVTEAGAVPPTQTEPAPKPQRAEGTGGPRDDHPRRLTD